MRAEILLMAFLMGLVTYIPRWLPLAYLSRRNLPRWFSTWLDFIPVSILSALVLPALVTTGEPRLLSVLRPELLVALPTFAIALKTRSLGITVVSGMFLFWMAGKFLG